MTLKTALILAGGKGTRLEEHTKSLPKPLLSINKISLLERIIVWLKNNGVQNIILGVAYKKELIKEYFKDGSNWGLKINYVEHDQEGGTEDAFKTDISQAIERGLIMEDNFYAMNGDQITDLQLEGITNKHLKNDSIVTVTTVKMKTNFGIVDSNNQDEIIRFQEKTDLSNIHINAGIYVFNKKIMNYLIGGNIEENAFRKLISEKKIYSFFYDGSWLTVNDKKELRKVEEYINKLEKGINQF